MTLDNLTDNSLVDHTPTADTLDSDNNPVYSCNKIQSETLSNPIHCLKSQMTHFTAKVRKLVPRLLPKYFDIF